MPYIDPPGRRTTHDSITVSTMSCGVRPMWHGPCGRRADCGRGPIDRGVGLSGNAYCSAVSLPLTFLASSNSVTATRSSARVLRSGASSSACFSAAP
jgi:hypothetical protein